MGDTTARATHYMTFPHTLSARTRANFTIRLFMNGVLRGDIGVDIHENPTNIYTASFVNDGTDYSVWTLVLSDPSVPLVYYTETWEVRKKTLETNIKQIRSRQDSDGGFFKSSSDTSSGKE